MECDSAVSSTCGSGNGKSEEGNLRSPLISCFLPIDDLGDSLLVEIFCRIRCRKSLIRCKCVSRRWLNLVSSPFFVRHRFLNHHGGGHPTKPSSSTRPAPSLQQIDPKESRFWFQESDLPRRRALSGNSFYLLASQDDLLLYALQDECYFPDPTKLYICNPFTMDSIGLPPAPKPKENHHFLGAGLLVKYHSSKEAGENKVDASTSHLQFWVVHLRRQGLGILGDIYSSTSGVWIQSFLDGSYDTKLKNSAVHDGKLHWVMHSKRQISRGGKVIAYDPSAMEVQYIHMPNIDDVSEPLFSYIIGSCCGCLRLIAAAYYRHPEQHGCLRYLVIWELNDQPSGEWSLIYKMYFNDLVCENSQVQDFVRSKSPRWICPLAIEEHDSNIVYLKINRYIVSCDLQKKELELVRRDRKANRNYTLSLVLQQQPTSLRDNLHFKRLMDTSFWPSAVDCESSELGSDERENSSIDSSEDGWYCSSVEA